MKTYGKVCIFLLTLRCVFSFAQSIIVLTISLLLEKHLHQLKRNATIPDDHYPLGFCKLFLKFLLGRNNQIAFCQSRGITDKFYSLQWDNKIKCTPLSQDTSSQLALWPLLFPGDHDCSTSCLCITVDLSKRCCLHHLILAIDSTSVSSRLQYRPPCSPSGRLRAHGLGVTGLSSS